MPAEAGALCSEPTAEQSSSAGLLVADLLQLRDGGVEVVFGCETKETGEIFNQEADGILGLGNSEVSLVNQVCRLRCARLRVCTMNDFFTEPALQLPNLTFPTSDDAHACLALA
jgi:hypothetical protein